jgi:hypothetical protein
MGCTARCVHQQLPERPALRRPWLGHRRLCSVIFIRLAGLFFAFVQITLLLRLALPFVEVPAGLVEYVPTLLEVTNLWLAPVEAVVERFEIAGIVESLGLTAEELISGPEEFEPIVIVAMAAWAVATMFALFVLRLIFRPVR